MNILKYIDRKITFIDQIRYLKSYLFFGAPLGYICVEFTKYLCLSNYKFNFGQLIISIIVNLLIASPLIINYYKHTKKYNKISKKIQENEKNEKITKCKALFDYKSFIKGEHYEIDGVFNWTFLPEKDLAYVLDNNERRYILKNVINKFDLDDIKEERLKKLKKLNKLWKN